MKRSIVTVGRTILALGLVIGFTVLAMSGCGDGSADAFEPEEYCQEICDKVFECWGEDAAPNCVEDCVADADEAVQNPGPQCDQAADEVLSCVDGLSCNEFMNTESECSEEIEQLEDACEGSVDV